MWSFHPFRTIGALVAVWLLFGSAHGFAAETDPEFREAKKVFQQKIHSKVPTDRAKAVKEFGQFPVVEGMELIAKFGFADASESVRVASREAIVQFKDRPEIGKALLDTLRPATLKVGMTRTTYGVLSSLSEFDSSEIDAGVPRYLDEFLGKLRIDPLPVFTLIDDLGKQGDDAALRMLVRMSKSKYFATSYALRRAIVQALSQMRRKEVISFFIDLLPDAKGQVQYDVVKYLTTVTGLLHRDDHQRWKEWWAENKNEFQFDRVKPVDPRVEQQLAYYGIPICAKRVVFVLDTSGSMRGEPIEAAKRALVETINKLPTEVRFNVVFFNSLIQTWMPELTPATSDRKQQAISTVYGADLRAGTASHSALEAALTLDPEVIYFLSDGAPTDGRPRDIVEALSLTNRTRRVSIHTIGVGTDRSEVARLGNFMKSLADSNWGDYRAVGF